MIRAALVVVGGAIALYFLTGGSRVPVAEGRSWRLAAGISTINWSKVYPDAVNRLSAARALVAVKIQSKESPTLKIPVLVRIDGKNGPTSFRGHFVAPQGDFDLPRPWGPPVDRAIVFELSDVFYVVED